jgi:coproporphyrinogen III oxidase-like Fe-S oxidoreductase
VAEKADLIQQGCFGTEDEIYEEFDMLKEILLEAGYARYEISNFSLISKSSIHNRVYWEMEEYLGLGLGASSLAPRPFGAAPLAGGNTQWRWTNTPYLPKYLAGETIDENSLQELTEKDYLIEKFFLALRTDRGVSDISEFSSVLVAEYEEKLKLYAEEGFIAPPPSATPPVACTGRSLAGGKIGRFVLTDRGMDCYNWIITELLKEV